MYRFFQYSAKGTRSVPIILFIGIQKKNEASGRLSTMPDRERMKSVQNSRGSIDQSPMNVLINAFGRIPGTFKLFMWPVQGEEEFKLAHDVPQELMTPHFKWQSLP